MYFASTLALCLRVYNLVFFFFFIIFVKKNLQYLTQESSQEKIVTKSILPKCSRKAILLCLVLY